MLEGDPEADPGPAWVVSRMCDEFGLKPTEAVQELEDCPPGLLADIMAFRSYARAKEAIRRAKSEMDVDPSPWVDQVFEVESIIHKRRVEARLARQQG